MKNAITRKGNNFWKIFVSNTGAILCAIFITLLLENILKTKKSSCKFYMSDNITSHAMARLQKRLAKKELRQTIAPDIFTDLLLEL